MFAARHAFHLQLGVHLKVDRDESGVAQHSTPQRGAMAAHDDARARPDRAGEIAPRVTLSPSSAVSRTFIRSRVGTFRDREWPRIVRSVFSLLSVMPNGHHARAVGCARRVHSGRPHRRSVIKALEIWRPPARTTGSPRRGTPHDVVASDALGRPRPQS